jgi:nitrite reductase/ring-hydroxylating ferredoxin subunit
VGTCDPSEDGLFDDFSFFCTTADLAQSATVGNDAGERLSKIVGKFSIVLLVSPGGQVRAVQATCPHQGGPLCEGEIEQASKGGGRMVLVCPWHAWKFDIDTGARVLESMGSGGRGNACAVGDIEDGLVPCKPRGGGARNIPVFHVCVRGGEVHVSTAPREIGICGHAVDLE